MRSCNSADSYMLVDPSFLAWCACGIAYCNEASLVVTTHLVGRPYCSGGYYSRRSFLATALQGSALVDQLQARAAMQT